MQYISGKTVGAALLGVLTAIVVNAAFDPFGRTDDRRSDVHVHADFLIYIDGERLDLTADKYQSAEGGTQHFYLHLHDNNGHVLHRHADGYTFADFLASIGFTLTNECFTTDTGERHCADDANVLRLYVNGHVHPSPTEYIIEEEDKVLLHYGTSTETIIEAYLEEITDDACISSGTCPERGVPPPETCSGATCEI